MILLQLLILAALAVVALRLEGLRRRIETLDPPLRGAIVPLAVRDASRPTARPRSEAPQGPTNDGPSARVLGREPARTPAPPILPGEAASARDITREDRSTGPRRMTPVSRPEPGERATPARPLVDLELGFGRHWAALIGGGLVAFGLVLLLRHSFEQGYVPPSVRLGGAALLSCLLCATAEVFRRRGTFGTVASAAGLARRAADIPSILLGTGLGGLFASTYAAHAVYGLLGAAPAFACMAVAALSGIAASLAYGPALAVLGYLAAQGAPLLLGAAIDGGAPVAAYAALVGVAGYATAHVGGWRRLENPAGAVLLLWAGLLASEPPTVLALVAVSAGAAALAVTVLRLRPRAAWTDWRADRGAGVALLLMAGQGVLLACRPAWAPLSTDGSAATALGFAILLAGFGFAATATRARAVAPALAAAVVGAVAILSARVAGDPRFGGVDLLGVAASRVAVTFALVSAAVLALAALALHRGSRRSPRTGLVGAASAAALLAAGDLALRATGGADGRVLAGLAAVQGAVLIAAARPRHGAIPPARQFATAAAASVGVALLGFALVVSGVGDGPLLALVLALSGAGAAVLAVLWASSLFATVAGIAAVPVLMGAGLEVARGAFAAGGGAAALGPFLADTLLPGLVLAGAAVSLRRWIGVAAIREADRCWLALLGARSPAPEKGQAVSLALMGTTATGLLLAALVGIVRFVAYGDPLAALSAPADLGLACTLALAAGLAASRLHRAAALPVLRRASQAGALAALPLAVAALIANPFVTGTPVGALPVVDLLVPAYLLPAVAAWRLARAFRKSKGTINGGPRDAAAAVAVAMMLAYVTFTVAQAFQGSALSLDRVTEAELWSYTVAWLLTAAALMACGFRSKARGLRIAALGILAATAGKVVFVDLADLTGVARAASVLALGLVLLGVGMVYGRLAESGEAS